MVETDNALKYSELQDAACRELGLGADASAKSGNDLTLLNRMVREGFDMASNPPHLPGEALTDPTHQWRWIHPWTTMLIWPALAADDDVTAKGSDKQTVNGQTTSLITLTGGATFHPSMVRQTIHFVTLDRDFVICRYVDTDLVRVVGDAFTEANLVDDDTFTIASGQFGMPDDFAGIESPLSEYQATQSRRPIQITGQHQIRRERNILINRLGFPHMVVFIPRYDVIQFTAAGATTALDVYDLVQRWDMVTTPNPNEDYTLEFKYRFRLLQLSSTNPYPPGGPHFGRLVMTATLARCELERFKVEGPRWSDFYRNLASAIAEDLRAVREEYIGPMWRGDDSGDGRNLHHSDTSLVVTVNDVVP